MPDKDLGSGRVDPEDLDAEILKLTEVIEQEQAKLRKVFQCDCDCDCVSVCLFVFVFATTCVLSVSGACAALQLLNKYIRMFSHPNSPAHSGEGGSSPNPPSNPQGKAAEKGLGQSGFRLPE